MLIFFIVRKLPVPLEAPKSRQHYFKYALIAYSSSRCMCVCMSVYIIPHITYLHTDIKSLIAIAAANIQYQSQLVFVC